MGELCGSECLECHYLNTFSIFLTSLLVCVMRVSEHHCSSLGQLSKVQVWRQKRALVFERAFLIFAFVELLRETIIIYHCYYCHWKHKRETIEHWCQRVMGKEVVIRSGHNQRAYFGFFWQILIKKEGKLKETRVCFNIFGDFKDKNIYITMDHTDKLSY